jgi:hypothetical protein
MTAYVVPTERATKRKIAAREELCAMVPGVRSTVFSLRLK